MSLIENAAVLPKDIKAERYEPGALSYIEVIPESSISLEALVFGETDKELSSIVAFAGDYYLRGFEVHFSDRPSLCIGPVHNHLTLFSIDGKAGERVISFDLHVGEYIVLRMVTNFRRQAVFGPDKYKIKWPPSL